MSSTENSSNGICRFVIDGDLTIFKVGEYHRSLITILSDGCHLQCHCKAIEDVDSAGLQLLLATQRQVTSTGGSFELIEPSAALEAAMEVAGMLKQMIGEEKT